MRAALFTFDDLCGIEPRQMQLLLREVDMRQLSVAIATATAVGAGLFTGALSERARESLLEEVDLARGAKRRPRSPRPAPAWSRSPAGMEEEGTLVLRSRRGRGLTCP